MLDYKAPIKRPRGRKRIHVMGHSGGEVLQLQLKREREGERELDMTGIITCNAMQVFNYFFW
jgi:hypothetical protein